MAFILCSFSLCCDGFGGLWGPGGLHLVSCCDCFGGFWGALVSALVHLTTPKHDYRDSRVLGWISDSILGHLGCHGPPSGTTNLCLLGKGVPPWP